MIQDKYGIDCLKMKVNKLTDFDERCGIKKEEYLATEYGKEFYMIRNKGLFGIIILKNQCEEL